MEDSLSVVEEFVRSNLEGLLDQKHGDVCDVTFELNLDEGKSAEVMGIKSLFALSSPVFKRMLYGDLQDEVTSLDGNITIEDITESTFRFLAAFFYGLDPQLTKDNVVDVLYAARQYKVASLETACTNFVKGAVAQFFDDLIPVLCQLYDRGLQKTMVQIVDEARIVQGDSGKKLLGNAKFIHLPEIIIRKLLQDDYMIVDEEEIWSRCVEWAKHRAELAGQKKGHLKARPSNDWLDISEAKSFEEDSKMDDKDAFALQFQPNDWRYYLRSMIRFFRFPVMSGKFFGRQVAPTGILTNEETIAVLTTFSVHDHPTPFENQPRGSLFIFDQYNDEHVDVKQGKVLRFRATHTGFVLFSSCKAFLYGTHEFSVKVVRAHTSLAIGIAQDNTCPSNTWISKLQGVHFYSFAGGIYGPNHSQRVATDKYGDGDVIGILVDCENGVMRCYKNGKDVGEHSFEKGKKVYPVIGASGNQTELNLLKNYVMYYTLGDVQ